MRSSMAAREKSSPSIPVRTIELAEQNARLNSLENIRFRCGDGFETLDQLNAEQARFGLIVLDPPKFAGSATRLMKR